MDSQDKKFDKLATANSFSSLMALIKRHLLVFVKNWTTVLFTLMVPLAILLVYVLFLRPMEIMQIKSTFSSEGAPITNLPINYQRQIYGIADTWMMAGIISISCYTVSLNTNTILVRDKENGSNKDFVSSPIKQSIISASYYIFNMFVTFVVNLIVFLICLIWLAIYGSSSSFTFPLVPGVAGSFAIIGIILLSTINASLTTFFICSFIKTESTLSSIIAIFSTLIGFLNGAYMPTSMLPAGIQYLTMFFPGAYSAGLFRTYFMSRPLEYTTSMLMDVSTPGNPYYNPNYAKVLDSFDGTFPMSMKFFQYDVTPMMMAIVLLIFIAIFVVLNLTITPGNIISAQNFKPKKKGPRIPKK